MPRDPEPDLERVYGLSAAIAAFRARPELVARIAHTEEQRYELREMLREAAKRRIAYREVPPHELSKMCDSQHHEGVCVWLRRGQARSVADAIAAVGQRGAILALDAVENPHNVGAIVRSAAYFGLPAVIVQTLDGRPLSASALRIAEGGTELVCVVAVASLRDALAELRSKGFEVLGTDAHDGRPIADHVFKARACVVLGNERDGLSDPVRLLCNGLVAIPGVDAMDSLNVSVAAGIVAYEISRRR